MICSIVEDSGDDEGAFPSRSKFVWFLLIHSEDQISFLEGSALHISGMESTQVLPSDLLHNAPRVELYNEDKAEQARRDAVDLLEEEREMAMIRSTIYQQDLRRFHARNVKSRAFQEGDLVLRVDQQKPHKLAPIWEGPFIVTRVLHNGAYHPYNVNRQIDEP